MNAFDTQKQSSIRRQIADMQEAEPGLTFTAAWKRLRSRRPDLFDYARPTASSEEYEPSPEQARAGKISRAQRVIHAQTHVLQQEDGLTFQVAWNTLKRTRPELFAALGQAASSNVRLLKCGNSSSGGGIVDDRGWTEVAPCLWRKL
jgi:hypothetical protein